MYTCIRVIHQFCAVDSMHTYICMREIQRSSDHRDEEANKHYFTYSQSHHKVCMEAGRSLSTKSMWESHAYSGKSPRNNGSLSTPRRKSNPIQYHDTAAYIPIMCMHDTS